MEPVKLNLNMMKNNKNMVKNTRVLIETSYSDNSNIKTEKSYCFPYKFIEIQKPKSWKEIDSLKILCYENIYETNRLHTIK